MMALPIIALSILYSLCRVCLKQGKLMLECIMTLYRRIAGKAWLRRFQYSKFMMVQIFDIVIGRVSYESLF